MVRRAQEDDFFSLRGDFLFKNPRKLHPHISSFIHTTRKAQCKRKVNNAKSNTEAFINVSITVGKNLSRKKVYATI